MATRAGKKKGMISPRVNAERGYQSDKSGHTVGTSCDNRFTIKPRFLIILKKCMLLSKQFQTVKMRYYVG